MPRLERLSQRPSPPSIESSNVSHLQLSKTSKGVLNEALNPLPPPPNIPSTPPPIPQLPLHTPTLATTNPSSPWNSLTHLATHLAAPPSKPRSPRPNPSTPPNIPPSSQTPPLFQIHGTAARGSSFFSLFPCTHDRHRQRGGREGSRNSGDLICSDLIWSLWCGSTSVCQPDEVWWCGGAGSGGIPKCGLPCCWDTVLRWLGARFSLRVFVHRSVCYRLNCLGDGGCPREKTVSGIEEEGALKTSHPQN